MPFAGSLTAHALSSVLPVRVRPRRPPRRGRSVDDGDLGPCSAFAGVVRVMTEQPLGRIARAAAPSPARPRLGAHLVSSPAFDSSDHHESAAATCAGLACWKSLPPVRLNYLGFPARERSATP